MKVSAIKVGERHRKDLGDIDALAASIADLGLLHPIVVDPQLRLIAGHRRFEAVKRLGWDDVPVTVVASVTDAAAALRAERDENTCRKDFAPTEAVALGLALEAIEKPKAKERSGARTDLPGGNLPPGQGGSRMTAFVSVQRPVPGTRGRLHTWTSQWTDQPDQVAAHAAATGATHIRIDPDTGPTRTGTPPRPLHPRGPAMSTFWAITGLVAWAFLAICGIAYLTGLPVGALTITAFGIFGVAVFITAITTKGDHQ